MFTFAARFEREVGIFDRIRKVSFGNFFLESVVGIKIVFIFALPNRTRLGCERVKRAIGKGLFRVDKRSSLKD